jgi:GcrA cell cycle regulator
MARTTDFAWTEEADAELRRLIENGASAGMIAQELSRAFAVQLSRNAISGRAHRKGFMPRQITLSKQPKAPAPPKVKRRTGFHPAVCARVSFPIAPPTQAEPPIDLAPTLRFFDRLPSDCAWIEGEPSFDSMCCGRPVIQGRPYCLAHCRLAYCAPATRKFDMRRAA